MTDPAGSRAAGRQRRGEPAVVEVEAERSGRHRLEDGGGCCALWPDGGCASDARRSGSRRIEDEHAVHAAGKAGAVGPDPEAGPAFPV